MNFGFGRIRLEEGKNDEGLVVVWGEYACCHVLNVEK